MASNKKDKRSSRPFYYGGHSPLYYGSSSKMPYYYGGNIQGGGADNESIVGTITLARMLRVVGQRWITVLVMLLLGIIGAFAVYRISPTIYEAKCDFTMDLSNQRQRNTGYINDSFAGPDYGSSYEEIFNTRLPDWRSAAIVKDIIERYRADHPTSTVEDKEITECLYSSEIEVVRRSRRISVAVRSQSPELAAQLANAYVKAIEQFTQKENVVRTEKAVAQIAAQTEKQEQDVIRKNKELLDFRRANKLDNYRTKRETLAQTLSSITTDILNLESQKIAAEEWQNVLAGVQENPDSFGSLPTSVPRAVEISRFWEKYQDSLLKKGTLLATMKEKNPTVQAADRETQVYKKQFEEVVRRAFETSKGNLLAISNQLKKRTADLEDVKQQIAATDSLIVEAESGINQRIEEKDVAATILKDLRQRLNEARIRASQEYETINIGNLATVPTIPILPKPIIIFSVGVVLGLGLGVFLVLVVDHLEDTVISISDIEQRLSLKVLAIFPHVRRKKREQVAKFIIEDKYSQFAEAVAGLRNLLDSPRYSELSKCVLCISTQPGEGKTVTSTSIAISSAQAGKKTLLVDFDLRRPRHAHVWDLKLTNENSFSHYLTKGDASKFEEIVNKNVVERLDVIASLSPDGVNPSSLLGSEIILEFFEWARANYDRIIIDSPPYGIVGDVMKLASLVDSVLIMCCPDRTRFKPIQHAARQLAESGANILGIIVNDVDVSNFSAFSIHSSYKSYAYGGYGYTYKPERTKNPVGQTTGTKSSSDADSGEAKEEQATSETAPKPSDNKFFEFQDDD